MRVLLPLPSYQRPEWITLRNYYTSYLELVDTGISLDSICKQRYSPSTVHIAVLRTCNNHQKNWVVIVP